MDQSEIMRLLERNTEIMLEINDVQRTVVGTLSELHGRISKIEYWIARQPPVNIAPGPAGAFSDGESRICSRFK